MIVKLIDDENKNTWYRNKVGESFDVENETVGIGDKEYYILRITKENKEKYFYIENHGKLYIETRLAEVVKGINTTNEIVSQGEGNLFECKECKICIKYIEGCPRQPITKEKIKKELDITDIKLIMLEKLHKDQQALFESKNRKYDDNFGKTFKEYGNPVLCIRLDDKLGRIKSLLLKGQEGTQDESILDTLQDLANYANMAIIELKMKKDEEIERRR